MKCIHCNHAYLYTLANGQRKCSKCKRKFSPAKIQREKILWQYFIAGETASKTSRYTQMHFATIQKHFDNFRREVAQRSDDEYQKNSHKITDYEEYLYLPRSLKAKNHIEKIKHFLTLAYDGKVYNLMMPSADILGLDPNNRDDQKLLAKYLKYSMVSKISTQRSTIRNFWEYFENFIVKYKGVSNEEFAFYLKEAEWRFNHQLH